LVILLPLLVVSSIAFFITPSMHGEKPIDVRAHYFRIHTAAYVLFAGYITLHALVELVLTGRALYMGQSIRLAGVGVCLCLALSRNEAVHWSLLVAITVLQAAFIAFFTPDLT
jgi:hypothetical protein